VVSVEENQKLTCPVSIDTYVQASAEADKRDLRDNNLHKLYTLLSLNFSHATEIRGDYIGASGKKEGVFSINGDVPASGEGGLSVWVKFDDKEIDYIKFFYKVRTRDNGGYSFELDSGSIGSGEKPSDVLNWSREWNKSRLAHDTVQRYALKIAEGLWKSIEVPCSNVLESIDNVLGIKNKS
jgi:hypothetical protein